MRPSRSASPGDRTVAHLADALSGDDAQWLSRGPLFQPVPIRVVADEWMWKRVQSANLGTEERAVVAWGLIDEYLRQGLSDEAIGLYESLDDATRQRITRGNLFFGTANSCRVRLWTELSFTLNSNTTDAALAVAYASATTSHMRTPCSRLRINRLMGMSRRFRRSRAGKVKARAAARLR